MAEQPSQTPLPSPGWTFLARGEKGRGMISRCPGGLIHISYGNLTVRFQREEFLLLARMVEEAATRLQNVSPHLADHRIVARPSVPFSLN